MATPPIPLPRPLEGRSPPLPVPRPEGLGRPPLTALDMYDQRRSGLTRFADSALGTWTEADNKYGWKVLQSSPYMLPTSVAFGLIKGIGKMGGNFAALFGAVPQKEVDKFFAEADKQFGDFKVWAMGDDERGRKSFEIAQGAGEIGAFVVPALGFARILSVVTGASPLLATASADAFLSFGGLSPDDQNMFNLIKDISESDDPKSTNLLNDIADLLATDREDNEYTNRARNVAEALVFYLPAQESLRFLNKVRASFAKGRETEQKVRQFISGARPETQKKLAARLEPTKGDPDAVGVDIDSAEASVKPLPGDADEALLQKAQDGDAKAQHNLGVMYDIGEGVTQDYAEAAKWYRKAAEQGNAKAQDTLGAMYDNGIGVTQDYAEAAKWYRKAAEQGLASAQYNLGVMYDYGYGVTKDIVEAEKWFSKAILAPPPPPPPPPPSISAQMGDLGLGLPPTPAGDNLAISAVAKKVEALPGEAQTYSPTSALQFSVPEADSYGIVLLDSKGRVLLRKPKNNYGGYAYTYAKGAPEPGETPLQTALREVLEETGAKAENIEIIGGLSTAYPGTAGSKSSFFVGRLKNEGELDLNPDLPETEKLIWKSPFEAVSSINRTETQAGKARDLLILQDVTTWSEAIKFNKVDAQTDEMFKSANPPLPIGSPTPEDAAAMKAADIADALNAPPKGSFNALYKEVGKKPGGSAAGAIYRNTEDNIDYLIKFYDDPEQAVTEVLASRIHQLGGNTTPQFEIVNAEGTPGKIAIRSQMVNMSPIDFNATPMNAAVGSSEAKQAGRIHVLAAILKDFDVVGIDGTNVQNISFRGSSSVVSPIDLGGSLRYRAQGGPKDYEAGTVQQDFKDFMSNPKSSAKQYFSPAYTSDPQAYVNGIREVLYNFRTMPNSAYKDLMSEFEGSTEAAKVIPIIRARVEKLATSTFYDDIVGLSIVHSLAKAATHFDIDTHKQLSTDTFDVLFGKKKSFPLLKNVKIHPDFMAAKLGFDTHAGVIPGIRQDSFGKPGKLIASQNKPGDIPLPRGVAPNQDKFIEFISSMKLAMAVNPSVDVKVQSTGSGSWGGFIYSAPPRERALFYLGDTNRASPEEYKKAVAGAAMSDITKTAHGGIAILGRSIEHHVPDNILGIKFPLNPTAPELHKFYEAARSKLSQTKGFGSHGVVDSPFHNYLDIMVSNGYGYDMFLAAKLNEYTHIDIANRVKKFTHGPEHPIGNAQYVDRFGPADTDAYASNTQRPLQAGFYLTEQVAEDGTLNKFLKELNRGAKTLESIYTTVPVKDEFSTYLRLAADTRVPYSVATVSPSSLHIIVENSSKKVKDAVGLTTNQFITPVRAYTYGKGGAVPDASADFIAFGSSFIKGGLPITITAAGVATVYDEVQAQDVPLESLLPPTDVPDEDELLLQTMQDDMQADDTTGPYSDDPYEKAQDDVPIVIKEEEEEDVIEDPFEFVDDDKWPLKNLADLFPSENPTPYLTGEAPDVYAKDDPAVAASWT